MYVHGKNSTTLNNFTAHAVVININENQNINKTKSGGTFSKYDKNFNKKNN
jgi:hypothetical protein